MVRFACGCGRQLQGRDEDAGKPAKCPLCGATSMIPSGQTIALRDNMPTRSNRPHGGGVQANRSDERSPVVEQDDDDLPEPRYDEKPKPRLRGGSVAALIIVALVLSCIFFIGPFLQGIRTVRSPSLRSQEHHNLKQLGTAMHNFASAYDGAFPQAAAFRARRQALAELARRPVALHRAASSLPAVQVRRAVG